MKIVITGTTSGLGAALFHRLKKGENHVIGSTHQHHEVRWPHKHLDLRNPNSIKAFAAAVRDECVNRVDVLINNAGINGIREFEHLDESFILEMMMVNCVGHVMLVKELLPAMKEGGRIINIVSDASWRPMRHSLAYNCSKAAFAMATKQMARELTKPYNIGVMGINPGKMAGTVMSAYIDRQVCELRGWSPEQAREYAKANSVTGRELPTGMVAMLIATIIEGKMPMYMSGAVMDLAGY